jgi:3-deoxy-D-manno-octulosonate 8-phosphate phosphatase (KDO 8-P phosphatase)
MRSINTKDGYAMQWAVKQGLTLGIITGGYAPSVRMRYEALGFQHIYMHSTDKLSDYLDFLEKTNISPAEICYVGDDIPDYEIMQRVGLPACPADAAPEIRAIARYISHCEGGRGVGRDILEQILRARGQWMAPGACQW